MALITGSSRGIGRGIACRFAREGASIIVNYARDDIGAGQTVADVRKLEGRALAIQADVANEKDVEFLVRSAVEEFGRIDVLVNNAGISQEVVPTVEQSLDNWERVIGTNLKGTFLCCRRVGAQMIRQGGGRVVNIGSVTGLVGVPMRSSYNPSKAAVINLTKVLASEWGRYGIAVNCVAPGRIETEMIANLVKQGKLDTNMVEDIPLGRLGTTEDVAGAALFLASDDAAYISGITLPVDGGWVVSRKL